MLERYCTICRELIADEHRLRTGSPYCSAPCKAKSDNARREARRKAFCEACGRRYRQPRQTAGEGSAVAANECKQLNLN